MVVYDSDLCRSTRSPCKHNAPLVVDSNRVVACTVTSQLLQAIAGRNGKVREKAGLIDLNELPKGNSCNCSKPAVTLEMEQFLSVSIGE